MSFLGNSFDDTKTTLEQFEKNTKQLRKDMDGLRAQADILNAKNESMKKSLLDVQSRSMRENLLFFGIPEVSKENCIDLVKDFCVKELKIDTGVNKLQIDRAHRIGNKFTSGSGKPRPIVAKFHSFQEKENIRQQSFMLKNTRYGISEQYPKEIADKRRRLMPVMKRERENGNTVKLVVDRLYINGREYRGPETRPEGISSMEEA